MARPPRGTLGGGDGARPGARAGRRPASPGARVLTPGDRRLVGQVATLAPLLTVFGLSFGVLATEAGLSPAKAAGLSLLVFAGGAQFAAVGVVDAGGAAASAVAAGLLLNARFLAMGVAAAPHVGRGWRSVVGSHLVIDESSTLALVQDDAVRARRAFWWAGLMVFVAWNASTVVGALVGDVLGDLERWGIDAALPAFFVALLHARVGDDRAARTAAVAGLAIAVALVPFTPPGVPVLASGLGALVAMAVRR